MNSQVSHNLVSSEFRIKREKNGFQFIATLHYITVKSFTSVWINSLLIMRINAIRFLQSKWTINGQELKIKALFLSVVIS